VGACLRARSSRPRHASSRQLTRRTRCTEMREHSSRHLVRVRVGGWGWGWGWG
jgi:hypothetical protein